MANDPPDWEALYQEQLPRIYNYFLYRVNDRQIAEELTSKTFLRAWKSRHRYQRDIADFSTWLITIAGRVVVDYYRRHKPQDTTLDVLPHLATDTPTPEQNYIKNATAAALGRAIRTLPEREQHLIALKYGAEMTNRAIAAQTGLSESNVGTILHRTVKHLRTLMTEYEGA